MSKSKAGPKASVDMSAESASTAGKAPQPVHRGRVGLCAPRAIGDRDWRVVMALQGGGALGAFQMGAYEALAEDDLAKQRDGGGENRRSLLPDWVTGISIGAINASIIAGNPPQRRVQRLKDFWEAVTTPPMPWGTFSGVPAAITSSMSMFCTVAFGLPGFFRPWWIPAALSPSGTPSATSYYSTHALRETLLDVIDFELLATAPASCDDAIRISLGATRIDGGRLVYFDNHKQGAACPRGPEYVMASGALPPGFGAVEVEGDYYWDGGVVSNSSLAYLGREIELDKHTIIFLIDLWTPSGAAPQCMDDVTWHEKQVRYSNRVGSDIQFFCLELARQELLRLANGVVAAPPTVDIVRVRYRYDSADVPYGDADFSEGALRRRRDQGYSTMRAVLAQLNQSRAIEEGLVMSEVPDFSANTWVPDQPGPILCMRGADGGWVRLHNF